MPMFEVRVVDRTVRVYTLKADDDEDAKAIVEAMDEAELSAVPNRMEVDDCYWEVDEVVELADDEVA